MLSEKDILEFIEDHILEAQIQQIQSLIDNEATFKELLTLMMTLPTHEQVQCLSLMLNPPPMLEVTMQAYKANCNYWLGYFKTCKDCIHFLKIT